MLYAGCSACRAIVPLVCTGQFMPHLPVPVGRNQTGFVCNMCGFVPPVLTCPNCWTQQVLFLPGAMPAPAATPAGGAQAVAPVVQAAPNAERSELSDAFGAFADSFAKELGAQAARAAASTFN